MKLKTIAKIVGLTVPLLLATGCKEIQTKEIEHKNNSLEWINEITLNNQYTVDSLRYVIDSIQNKPEAKYSYVRNHNRKQAIDSGYCYQNWGY